MYTLPIVHGNVTSDWAPQKSSSHAIADDAGQPEPVYTAIFVSSCWPHVRTPAVPLNELNTTMDESDPEVRGDGLEIVFHSLRTGGMGNYDLYHATRASTYRHVPAT